MKALIWKRLSEIRQSQFKKYFYLLSPIIYGILILMFNVPNVKAAGYFCIAVTLINNLIHWNVEDIIYSEVLMTTSLKPFSIWIVNCAIITFSGYFYSFMIMIIYTTVFRSVTGTSYVEGIIPYLQSLSTFPLAFALIGISTIHYVDFSKIKQYFSSIFGIINFLLPIALILFNKYLPVSINTVIFFIIGSILIITIGIWLVTYSNKEKLIINIQKLSDAYEAKIVND